MRHVVLLLLTLSGCDGWPESPRPPAPLPPPAGSVARGAAAREAALAPPGPAVDAALLTHGAGRYAIHCAPCHGGSGAGDGVVVARGHPPIAPLPPDPVRSVAAIGANLAGAHAMADKLDARDRWAVARHVEVVRRGAPARTLP
jgi:mono/diheme cytochrome c family protein